MISPGIIGHIQIGSSQKRNGISKPCFGYYLSIIKDCELLEERFRIPQRVSFVPSAFFLGGVKTRIQ